MATPLPPTALHAIEAARDALRVAYALVLRQPTERAYELLLDAVAAILDAADALLEWARGEVDDRAADRAANPQEWSRTGRN